MIGRTISAVADFIRHGIWLLTPFCSNIDVEEAVVSVNVWALSEIDFHPYKRCACTCVELSSPLSVDADIVVPFIFFVVDSMAVLNFVSS
jgi:hypothetical protein